MRVLDGFRMYAMLWLFIGGTYLFATYFVLANPQDISYYYSKFAFTIIPMSYLGVDVFLFISGIVNAYSLLKLESIPLKLVIRLYLKRWARNFIIALTVMYTASIALGRVI